MPAKYLTMILVVAVLAAKSNAQGVNATLSGSLLFGPPVIVSAPEKLSTPLSVRPIPQPAPVRAEQTNAASRLKECPMPVHRPDTSALEQMRVARPSPGVSYSMPRVELKCPNPLDPAK
jgi:hypothetical protein